MHSILKLRRKGGMEVNQYVVKTDNMTKIYGKHHVVDRVDMRVKKGAIYGFIGLNGAGKSTCIRMITGLTNQSLGQIELFGKSDKNEVNQSRKRMGTMIEAPGLYPHMTAEQNLEVIRRQRGIPGRECIKKTLKKVGLKGTGKKKVGTFSLGMKQRLGIAVALLSNPELLILDEPINGLDPVGVIEIRQLLQQLNEEYNVTLIISSHILTEVHQIATHYGIIHEGKLIEQCTRDEVEEKCQSHLYLCVDNVEKTTTILEENMKQADFEILDDGAIKLFTYVDDPLVVSRLLNKHHVLITEMTPKRDTLEGYFTRVIKEASV